MSHSAAGPPSRSTRFAPGPEVPYLVAAVAALLVEDTSAATGALNDAVTASSWAAVEHRVEVVGRALVVDAELEPSRGPHPDGVHLGDERTDEERWSATWTGLQVIASLVKRAGYPPEVLA